MHCWYGLINSVEKPMNSNNQKNEYDYVVVFIV